MKRNLKEKECKVSKTHRDSKEVKVGKDTTVTFREDL